MTVQWKKSSRSNSQSGGNCVEVAHHTGLSGLRDSKNPTGGELWVNADDFRELVTFLRTTS